MTRTIRHGAAPGSLRPAPDGWGGQFAVDPVLTRLPALYKPAGLRRFHADMADALNSQVNIVAIGDSVTAGIGSDNNVSNAGGSPVENISWEQASWAPQLRLLLNAHLGTPDPGLGLLRGGGIAGSSAGDWRQSYTGSGTTVAASTGSGPLQVATSLPSTSAKSSWSLPAGVTEIDVMYSLLGTLAVPTTTIDGSAGIAITGGTSADNNRFNIGTGLSGSAHTVVLTGASAQSRIGGLIVRNQKTNGVLVHRLGIGGLMADHAAGSGLSGSALAAMLRSEFDLLTPSLAIISYSINDWLNSESIATFKGYLQTMIDRMVTTLSKCVLLVDNPQTFHTSGTTPPAPTTPSRADYSQAMRDLCDTNDHVAYLAHPSVFGSFSQAIGTDMNLMLGATNSHPNRRGYGLMARSVFKALTQYNIAQAVS